MYKRSGPQGKEAYLIYLANNKPPPTGHTKYSEVTDIEYQKKKQARDLQGIFSGHSNSSFIIWASKYNQWDPGGIFSFQLPQIIHLEDKVNVVCGVLGGGVCCGVLIGKLS